MVTEQKIYETIIWPYRLIGNLLLLALISAITLGVITIRHNLVSKQMDSLLDEFYQKTAVVGWGLDDIILEGRQKTTKQEVLNAIGLERGVNILEIDLVSIRDKVESLPWVKSANVTRRYFPNIIHISINEKNIGAIWQYKNEFYPIDEAGQIIETEYVPEHNILQIIGEGAPENFKTLLDITKNDKDLFQRLKAAHYISNRRWNLIFDDVEKGVTVKMPEDNLAEAWKKLVKLDKTRGILKRKLTFIDLRLKNKVIVHLNTTDSDVE